MSNPEYPLNKQEIDFPTSPEYTKEDIRRVQRELTKMAGIVCGILEKHNIPYFMAFGTLMGAVKFHGFLPWDDDIDLFLFEDSYENAIAHLEKELPGHLIVHSEKNDPHYFLAWNKIKNLNTEAHDNNIYNPDNKLLGYKCLGIDLYRLKKTNPAQVDLYKTNEAIAFFERKRKCNLIDEENYFKEMDALQKRKEKLTSTPKSPGPDVYSFILKLKKNMREEDIFPLRKYPFEELHLFGPHNCTAILEAAFGDFSELPGFSERKTHLKKVKFFT